MLSVADFKEGMTVRIKDSRGFEATGVLAKDETGSWWLCTDERKFAASDHMQELAKYYQFNSYKKRYAACVSFLAQLNINYESVEEVKEGAE